MMSAGRAARCLYNTIVQLWERDVIDIFEISQTTWNVYVVITEILKMSITTVAF